jgi:molybdopterin converting factor small subunit
MEILLFAGLKEKYGKSIHIDLSLPVSVDNVITILKQKNIWVEGSRIAVNKMFCDENDEVPFGAEVAVIPPVSGGCR